MPGPPPKPTAMLKLSGSWRAAARDQTEPKPLAGPPPRPDWLDEEGVAAWEHLVPILARMRVLTEADAMALSMLCEAWSRYRRATDMLAKHGDVYQSGQTLRRSPYSAMQMELALIVRRMLSEFGLTPAARGRIVALPEDKTIGKAGYFQKPQAAAEA